MFVTHTIRCMLSHAAHFARPLVSVHFSEKMSLSIFTQN